MAIFIWVKWGLVGPKGKKSGQFGSGSFGHTRLTSCPWLIKLHMNDPKLSKNAVAKYAHDTNMQRGLLS